MGLTEGSEIDRAEEEGSPVEDGGGEMRQTKRHFHISGEGAGVVGLVSVPILLAIAAFAAWATHIVWIIKVLASSAGATAGQMVLGALGAFMPPVGVIHGVMIWFGVGF